jgi:acetylxylan esterase
MLSNILTLSLIAGALAVPIEGELEKRITCPSVHIFGARETTASAGYGSSSTVVNGLLSAYSGSTAEAISYPACGGQASCGSVSYSNSVAQGIAAVASAVNSYNSQCPSTKLVLVGYSQVTPRLCYCHRIRSNHALGRRDHGRSFVRWWCS